jgi:hypothetical protein
LDFCRYYDFHPLIATRSSADFPPVDSPFDIQIRRAVAVGVCVDYHYCCYSIAVVWFGVLESPKKNSIVDCGFRGDDAYSTKRTRRLPGGVGKNLVDFALP